MLRYFVLFAVIGAIYGASYSDLRVKYGFSDDQIDKENFFRIPRTLSDAKAANWKPAERPPGPMPELKLQCSPGRIVCALYSTNGFIAGLQIALPTNEFDSLDLKPEQKFVKWTPPASEGEPAKEFWTATQYFVSEASLKTGLRPNQRNGATLQDGGVWVAGKDGKLLKIPISENELKNTPFKKQNCIPNMGTHYYYKMTPQLRCEEVSNWFALTSGGELVGTGFYAFGTLPVTNPRDWFERFTTDVGKSAIPNAPKCLDDWSKKYGVLTMHIYYADAPWTLRCAPGDSIRP